MSPRYVARWLAQVLPTVGGLLVVTFLLIRLAPGDPVLALASGHGDPAHHAFIRHKFGLDRSLPEQFGRDRERGRGVVPCSPPRDGAFLALLRDARTRVDRSAGTTGPTPEEVAARGQRLGGARRVAGGVWPEYR